MFKRGLQWCVIVMGLLGGALVCSGQPRNLLQNPNADLGAESWRGNGAAAAESTTGNNLCFVVRNGGYFLQDVALPDNSAGQYLVFIGRGASERINADGAITGLPYLHGYMMEENSPKGQKLLAHLQGERMRASTTIKDEWVDMWGIFQVPAGTKEVRFFLNQALRKGVPHNGSAARFDNLGLYLFSTKAEAEAFINQYH